MFVISKNGRPFATASSVEEAQARVASLPDAPVDWGTEYEIEDDGRISSRVNPRVFVGGWYRIDEV